MWTTLLDLVAPRRCPGCGNDAARQVVCESCVAVLDGPARRVRPTPCPPGFAPTRAVAAYHGPVRALLVAHKEHARLGLSGPLGDAIARAAVGFAPTLLVPVPSSASARRRRGYDHTARLARGAAQVLGVGWCPALGVVRATADQAGLDAGDRAANVAGAFAVRARHRARVVGARVVLVDDVVTTGATLAEAARALGAAGAVPVGAATVAATVRWSAPPRRGTPHQVGTGIP